MGLHRLTPVMTSAQRHNKANSRLLQVQLLGLPGGEQKTPKKRCHVGGGTAGCHRSCSGQADMHISSCTAPSLLPHPLGPGTAGPLGWHVYRGLGKERHNPMCLRSLLCVHSTQNPSKTRCEVSRGTFCFSFGCSRPVLGRKPPGSSCFKPKHFGACAWHPSGRKQRRSEGTTCPLTEVILQSPPAGCLGSPKQDPSSSQ